MFSLKEFIENIPDVLLTGASISMVCFSVGGAVALARSSGVEVSKESLSIQREAAKKDLQLQNANREADICGEVLTNVKVNLEDLGEKNTEVKELAKDIQLVQGIIHNDGSDSETSFEQ